MNIKLLSSVDVRRTKQQFGVFEFGNCGIVAISNAFELPSRAIEAVTIATGCKFPEKGITFKEANRSIFALGKSCNYNVMYYKNSQKLSYIQLISVYLTGTYIINFEEHLACLDSGVVYDTYYQQDEFSKIIPLGWWKIK